MIRQEVGRDLQKNTGSQIKTVRELANRDKQATIILVTKWKTRVKKDSLPRKTS